MTDDKWDQIKEMANQNFEVIENEAMTLPEEQGGGSIEHLIFNGPLGKIKLEFIVKPLIIDKKTHYSKRAGQETKIEYVYSETEKTRTFKAYKWEESLDDWQKISSDQFE